MGFITTAKQAILLHNSSREPNVNGGIVVNSDVVKIRTQDLVREIERTPIFQKLENTLTKNTNAVLESVSDLEFSGYPKGIYELTYFLNFTTFDPADIRFEIDVIGVPATVAYGIHGQNFHINNAGNFVENGGVEGGFGVDTLSSPLKYKVSVHDGTGDGVQLLWAQNSAQAGDTKLLEGSVLRIRRLAGTS